MHEKRESSVEKLQEQFPVISSELGSVALRADTAHEIATDLSAHHKAIRDLEIRQRDERIEASSEIKELTKSVLESESLDDLEKIVLAEQLHLLHTYGQVPADEAFRQVGKKYSSALSSLKAVERIVKKDGQPILYFQIEGGERFVNGFNDPNRPALVTHIFRGLTNGSGLDTSIDGHGEWVSFGLRDYEPTKPKNFVTGYFKDGENPEIGINRVNELVGTAALARQIIKQGRQQMQSNPVFVGEKACGVAEQLLAEKTERNLFEIVE